MIEVNNKLLTSKPKLVKMPPLIIKSRKETDMTYQIPGSSNIDFTKILTFLDADRTWGSTSQHKRLSILNEFFTTDTDRSNNELQDLVSEIAWGAFVNGCRSKLNEARAILSILRFRELYINKSITWIRFLRRVSKVRRVYVNQSKPDNQKSKHCR